MEWRCKCGRIELDDRPGWGDWLHVPVLVKHLLPGEEEGDQPPPAPRLARQRWEPCLGYADLPLRLLCCGMDGAAWKAAALSSVVASAAAASLTWLGLLLCGRGGATTVGWFSSPGAAGPAQTREAVSSSAYIISVHGRDPLCFFFQSEAGLARAAAGRGVGDARRRRDATTRSSRREARGQLGLGPYQKKKLRLVNRSRSRFKFCSE
jgi:hypothetical protein